MALEIVSTKYGQVRGVIEEDVLLFKGVPYAAPPVGELRWKEPQDPAPWQGVRDCDTYGPGLCSPLRAGWALSPGHLTSTIWAALPTARTACI